ncbi:MAG: DUF4340 domain-containing protein [Kiritimatiellae bacterium]|nr:DUF4340 domain-containing protein [Kiritimatiellia bacterium]
MKVKLNIFLFLVAIIFGGIVFYLVQFDNKPIGDTRKAGVLSFSFLGSDINSVSIKNEDWKVDASNIGGRWYLLRPVYDLARQGIFESVFSMVENMKYQEIVTPKDMKDRHLTYETFGLDNPTVVITLFFDNDSIEVVFGKRTRLGDYIYVKSSESEKIYTVSSKIIDILPKTIDELRDPDMFNIDSSLLDVVKMKSSKAGFVELKKVAGEWYFEQPDIGPVDSSFLFDIFDKLVKIKIKNYVWQDLIEQTPSAEGALDYDGNNILYERYGLKDSDVLFDIDVTDPILGDTYGLKISQHSPENLNLHYILRNNLPDIFSVILKEDDLRVLNFSLNDLRSKRLYRTEPEFVTEIAISKNDNRFVMTWTNGLWAVTEPVFSVADRATISSFLNYFTKQTRIVDFVLPEDVDSLKLEPYVNLSFNIDKGNGEHDVEKLEFYTSQKDSGKFYGKFSDRDDIFLLPYETKLIFGPDLVDPYLFYNKTILNVATEDIGSISTKSDAGEKIVELSEDGIWVADGQTNVVNMVAVNSILFSIANLRAECIVDSDPENLEQYGLENPKYILKVGFSTGAGIQKSLLIGALAGDDGARYAMVKGKNIIFVLSPAELSNLTLGIY